MKESVWPDERWRSLLGVDLPIVQAPMAGSVGADLVVAVSEAGGLSSLPCAMLRPEQIASEFREIRRRTTRPVNLNFFCHSPPPVDAAREDAWRRRLAGYYAELGVDPPTGAPSGGGRTPFDATSCDLVRELRPEVVSFHFGLPAPELLAAVRATGARVLSSATTVEEARWLEERGCDGVIVQGAEAGGHRAMFLADDVSTQVGTFSLLPQVALRAKVPVIASGGIADGRGIVAAFALGAAAVQIGTSYLFCPEASPSPPHARALRAARDGDTAITNVLTGRPARGIVNRAIREVGPMSPLAPAFPRAAATLAPLREHAEARGSGDFSPLWAGQSAALGREMPAGELTRRLAADALALLSSWRDLARS